MKLLLKLMLFMFPLTTLAACNGVESTQPAAPEGPALIMFYTDG